MRKALQQFVQDVITGLRWLIHTRIGGFIGHWSGYVFMMFYVYDFITQLAWLRLHGLTPPEGGHSGFRWSYLLFSFTVVTLVALNVAHSFNLCTQCAAELPLNGPELAVERRVYLRAYHRIGFGMFFIFLAAVLATSFIRRFVVPVSAVMDVYWFSVFALGIHHARLSLWCPYCHGKGDDDDEVFEPDGPPGRERQPT